MTGIQFKLIAVRTAFAAAVIALAGILPAFAAPPAVSPGGRVLLAQKLEVIPDDTQKKPTPEAAAPKDKPSASPDEDAVEEEDLDADVDKNTQDEGVQDGAKTDPDSSKNENYVPPPILRDLAELPFPARTMHELLMEAAKSGDIEKLRPFIGSGDDVTMLSFGGMEGDPIDFLKSTSGDPEGHEILAILEEVLDAGFVRIDEGTPNEIYVWPYFYAVPADKLTPPQRVELFKLLTYGDYQEMVTFGAYFFYRVGITPQGRWRFFVAGD